MNTISCNAVSKSYGTGFLQQKTVAALTKVSFDIEEHELFGFVGPNGAGKSTLLKILMGFIRHDAGTVQIRDCQGGGGTESRRLLGYLPERPCLYPHLTPRDHLLFGAKLQRLNKNTITDQIEKVLQTVDLLQFADTPIRKFSKGMTQRAALAYALLPTPEILVLDEPMSGLDPIGRQTVIDILLEAHKGGCTILFCSHILSDVERFCDRIGIMNKGELVTTVTPAAVFDRFPPEKQRGGKTPLESFFLHTSGEGSHVE